MKDIVNKYMYDVGWNAALEAVAKMVEVEAGACVGDIVPGDEIGRREANARAGALLTAALDIRALVRDPSRVDGQGAPPSGA
jgi:hypothetical protein